MFKLAYTDLEVRTLIREAQLVAHRDFLIRFRKDFYDALQKAEVEQPVSDESDTFKFLQGIQAKTLFAAEVLWTIPANTLARHSKKGKINSKVVSSGLRKASPILGEFDSELRIIYHKLLEIYSECTPSEPNYRPEKPIPKVVFSKFFQVEELYPEESPDFPERSIPRIMAVPFMENTYKRHYDNHSL